MDGEEKYQKDIIDGLQRLNAIFSFIKNEFPVRWEGMDCYFNVSAIAGSDELIEKGVLIQRENKLDQTTSRNFLNYQLPVTTTEVSDSEIEDIFIRINSTGRKLSKQDLRQAGAVGLFSDLVRKTACYIRGDVTEKDLVVLSEMPALSLSGRHLKYNINIKDTFWLKHKILTENNIRISRDEEVIARIYSYIILGAEVSPSSNALNSMYNSGSTQNQALNNHIEKYGLVEMMDVFSKVYSDFNKIFQAAHSTFSNWIFSSQGVKGKAKVFQALFLSLYELRCDFYEITDYQKVADALKNIGNSEFREITNDAEWNTKIRNDSIRRIKSILEPLMTKTVAPKENEEWKLRLEMLLSAASGVEAQMYDFKLGLTTLQDSSRNTECIPKIVKTLTAMANTHPTEDAVVIIGIANDVNAANKHKEHYKTNWIKVADCYVTGVDAEIKKYWKNKEEFFEFIRHSVENSPVSSEVSGQILRNFRPIVYEGKTLVLLTFKNEGKPYDYDQEFFERQGSNNVLIKIGTPEFYNLLNRTQSI